MKIRALFYLVTIAITCLVCMAGPLYASDDDPFTRKSRAETDLYGSGYLASTAAKSDSVMRQDISKQASLEMNATDTNKKTAGKVTEGAANKVAPELKKKTSSGGEVTGGTGKIINAIGGGSGYDPERYKREIGTGVAIHENPNDQNSRVIGEKFGDETRIYVGFTDKGYLYTNIQDGINKATAGQIVLVGASAAPYTANILNIGSGIKLYGISGGSGNPTLQGARIYFGDRPAYGWNTVSTNLDNSGTISDVEIRGFTLNNSRFDSYYNMMNITITDNVFVGGGFWVDHSYLASDKKIRVTLENNRFSNAELGLGFGGYFYNGQDPRDYPKPAGSYYNQDDIEKRNIVCTLKNNTFEYSKIFSGSMSTVIAEGNTLGDTTLSFNTYDFISRNNNYLARVVDTTYGYQHPINVSSEGDYFSKDSFSGYGWKHPFFQLHTKSLSPQQIVSNKPAATITTTAKAALPAQYKRRELNDKYLQDTFFSKIAGKPVDPNLISAIAKTLAQNMTAGGKGADADAAAKAVNDALIAAGIVRDVNPEAAALADKLADLFSRATGEDKSLLDSFKALLETVKGINDQAQREELTKAENDYATVVAAIFLAQSIPDLLREGDALAIRSIFADAATVKNTLVAKYQDAVTPYYDEIKKDLVKHTAALKARGVLAQTLTQDAILKLTPAEVDRIVRVVRQVKDPSVDERAFLTRESALRALYITPNLVILEQGMRLLLKDCTQALYSILYERGANKDMALKPVAGSVKQ